MSAPWSMEGGCPGENEVLDFLARDGARPAALTRHFVDCGRCRQLVEILASRSGSSARGRHDEPELALAPTESATPSDQAELDAGARFGRFVILRRLGAGGMGVVYEAYDPELDRKCAVKILRERATVDGAARARLVSEARALAKLAHPNVTVVHDCGQVGDRVFLSMELVAGMTLREWLAAKPRRWRDIVAVFVDAGRGLAAAHAVGLVHRDVKPENILIGSDGRTRINDLGLARVVGASPNALPLVGGDATRIAGTPRYMAPEQHRGDAVSPATDQFSYCIALYEALYARTPFAGATPAEVRDHVLAGRILAEPPGARVPRALRQIVRRGLALVPSARFASMDQLLEALGRRNRLWRWGRLRSARRS